MAEFDWNDFEAVPFNPEGGGYDYMTAWQSGLEPDVTGHYPSRDPITGQILKGISHETIDRTLAGEREAGYEVYQQGERYYSKSKGEFSWEDYEGVSEEAEDYGPIEGVIKGVGTAAKGLPRIPISAATTVLRAYRGGDDLLEDTVVDKWINTLERWNENFNISEEEAKKKFIRIPFTDIEIKQGDIGAAEESIGYSLTNMIAMKLGQAGGGAVGSLATPFVGKITGIATGTLAGMVTAQRATTDQFMDMFKDQIIKELGKGPEAQAVFDQIKDQMGMDPFWYGLAEAVPEVAGNWLMFGIAGLGRKGVAKAGLEGVTKKVAQQQGKKFIKTLVKMGIPAAKAAGMISEELMTETVTQYIQGNIEYRNGLRDAAPTLEESFEEVLGPVLLATPILGAGAHVMENVDVKERLKGIIHGESTPVPEGEIHRKADAQKLIDALFAQPIIPGEPMATPADISEIPMMVERQLEPGPSPEEMMQAFEGEEEEVLEVDFDALEPQPPPIPQRKEQKKFQVPKAPKGVRVDAVLKEGELGYQPGKAEIQVSMTEGPAKGATFNLPREGFEKTLTERVEEYAKTKYGAEYPIGEVKGYRGASEETVLKPHQTGAIYIARKREGATRYATGEERKIYEITTNVENPFDTSIRENAEKLQEIDDPRHIRQFEQNVDDIVRNGKLFVTTAQKDWLLSQGYDVLWNPQEDAIAALRPEKVQAKEEVKKPAVVQKAQKKMEIPTIEEWRKAYTIEGKKYLEGATTRRARKINRQIDAAFYEKYGRETLRFKPVKKPVSPVTAAWKAKRTRFTPTERKKIQQELGRRRGDLVDVFHMINKKATNAERSELKLAKETDEILAAKQFSRAIGAPAIEFITTDNEEIKQIGGSTILTHHADGSTTVDGVVIVVNSKVMEKYPLITVMGHESMHVLETERPDLYKRFLEFMWENRIEENFELFSMNAVYNEPESFDADHPDVIAAARRKGISPEKYAFDGIKSEWLAQFAGTTWTQERFLRKMSERLPEVLGKLLDIMVEMLRRFREIVSSKPSPFVHVPFNKVIEAENRLADIYEDFIKGTNKSAKEPNKVTWDDIMLKLSTNMRKGLEQESIVAASVRIDGKYYTGLTHIGAIQDANEKLGREWDNLNRDEPRRYDGFKTSTGRYVTRGEAMAIAEKAEQLKPEETRELVGAEGEVLAEEFKPGELKEQRLMSKKIDAAIDEIGKKEIKGYATESREDILRLLKITGGAGNLESFLKKAGVEKGKSKRIAAIAASMEEYPFPDPSWTARELEKFDKEHPEYKFWYEKTKWLEDVFKDKDTLDLFRGLALLSHTSRNKGTLANMVEFVKAWTKWHAGEIVNSGLVEQHTIDRVLNAETLADMFKITKSKLGFEEGDVKVKAFAETFAAAMRKNKELRNALKTVVDVWMNRYFFPTRYTVDKKGNVATQPLSGVQHFRIQQHMREVERILSQKTGTRWTPDMAQATLWFFIREQYELQPDYQRGQEGYDFDQTLKIIAAKWAGIAEKFASNELTHSYILMKLRDPRVRWVLDHYTSKDNDFKMALTSFQGTGLFTGEEWNNQPEDANRPMRMHFFEAGETSGEARAKMGAAKRMRAVIETGQIYNLDQDINGYREKHNVQPQDHYSLASMEYNMIEDGFVGFQTDNKVVLFEPTRVHEMKKYQISVSPQSSKEVIAAIKKEITKLGRVQEKKRATKKEKSQAAFQKQVLNAILGNVRQNMDMIKKGELEDLFQWNKDQLEDLFNHPLIDVQEILPVDGRFDNITEPGISVVLEAGDINVLKGKVAQFLQYNGQMEGYISEVLGDVGQRTKPYSKKDEHGNPIYDVADNQAPSVILYWKEELSKSDLKELDSWLQKNGFAGSTYYPDKNITLLHHIPKWQTKISFLNNAMQAIIDIAHADPLFNKLSKKFAGYNQLWFKHTVLENPWKQKPQGETYENLVKKGYTTGRDIGFTASPEIVAGAREKREKLLAKGKDIFESAPRPADPKAKSGVAQFIATTVYDRPKISKQKKMVEDDMNNAQEYVLGDGTAGYTLSDYGQISDVWSTKPGRGAFAVLSAIANGGRYSVVTKGPHVEWFESFGMEATGTDGERVMMQFQKGMTYDPYILAGVFESTWNKRIDADPDSANLLNEIVFEYGESLRSRLGAQESKQIKEDDNEYLERNWVSYQSGVSDTVRENYNPYKNVYVKKNPNASQEGRTLLVQLSSNTQREEATTQGDKYFDTLYSQREGYSRPEDFWEVPDWMAQAAYTFDADVYIARNINEAIKFLNNSNYDQVMTSVMDSNKEAIKRMIDKYSGKVILGGYINKDYFPEQENLRYLENLEQAAREAGIEYKKGYDYSHFEGTETVPRLECSQGCLYRCAFCVVPKKIIEAPKEAIDQQVEAFKDLKFKLVYLNDKTFGQAKNYKYLEELNSKIKKQNPDFQGFIIQTTAVDFNKMDRDFIERSGIKYVELGAETINDDILQKLRKPHRKGHLEMAANKMRSMNLRFIPNIMVGLAGVHEGKLWTETEETYQNTLDFLNRHKDIISHINAYVLATYEGTTLADQLGTNETDSDENVIAKSWLKNKEVHERFYQDILDFGTERLAGEKRNLSEDEVIKINENFLSRRSYESAPDWAMGMSTNPFQAKGYAEQAYPMSIKVRVKYEDQVFDDEIKGLNVYHALERARRNWEGAEVELLDVSDKDKSIEAKWMRNDDIEHDTVGNVTTETRNWLKEKVGYEQKNIIEKAWEGIKNFQKNWREQGFDRMQPIAAKLGGEDGEVYMRHRAVPGVMSTVASFLEHGLLYWDEKMVPTVRTQAQGFIKWLNQGLGKDADKFFYWLIAKRAEVLAGEKRERWLSEDDRQRILDWVGKPTQAGKTWEDYNEEFQAFNKNVLDFAEEAGLINAEQRENWESEFYIPFYRILENQETREEYLRAPGRGKQHLSSTIRRLYGGEAKIGDPLHNIIRNWSNLIGESMANTARGSAYDYAMENPTMTEDGLPMIEDASAKDIQIYKAKKTRPGEPKVIYVFKKTGEPVLSFMRDGKKKYFKVNDVELFNSLSMINRPYFDNIIMKLMGTTKHWLTYGATFGPAFKVKNMIRDALHSYTIVPGFRPWNVFKGMASVWREDQDYVEFMASGNSFTGSYIRAEDPKAMEKYLKKQMPRENIWDKFQNRITGREGKTAIGRILDTPGKLLQFWERLGDASENAVRVAIFKKYKAEEDRLIAGFKARDVMDFQMSGASSAIQMLIQTVPFLNARAQGLYKMGREARKNPVSYITKGATIGIASMILWGIFKDDERYKELEDWEKWSYYHFWIGDEHFRIPKPFETGVIWSSMYEAFGNVFNGTEEGGHILDFFQHAIQQTLAFNPIPQLFMPVLEQYFNKVFFTGRPIEGERLQGLQYGERYDPWTSETMRLAGKLGIPPKRAETFIRGYFSTVGMLLLGISDIFVRHAFDFPERPDMKVDHMPLIGAFYRSGQAQNTKFSNKFYDTMNEVNRAYSTIKFYRELGTAKGNQYADYLVAKHAKALEFRKRFNAISREFIKVNNDIRNTWMDEEMSGEEKRKQLDKLYGYKNKILRDLFKDYEGEK